MKKEETVIFPWRRYPGYQAKDDAVPVSAESWRRIGPIERRPVSTKNMRNLGITKKYQIMNNPRMMSMG